MRYYRSQDLHGDNHEETEPELVGHAREPEATSAMTYKDYSLNEAMEGGELIYLVDMW